MAKGSNREEAKNDVKAVLLQSLLLEKVDMVCSIFTELTPLPIILSARTKLSDQQIV